jgi:predicted O-linked N-acetylglucosamine transferase (SPINDLY family)
MKTRPNDRIRPAKQPFQKRPETPISSTVDFLLQKAVGHHRAGQLSLAQALYQKILQVSPKHPDALHFLGVIAYQAGKYAMAVKLFDESIQVNPRHAEVYSNLSNALHALHQYQAAVESCDKAIHLKPDFADAYNNRGNALNGLQQYQAALENCDTAIRLQPDHAAAYNNRGNALNGLFQFQAALGSFDKAISINPGFADAYSNRSNALHSLQQYQAALISCDKAISLNPGFAKAYNNRGNALHGLQQYQEALESFDKAIGLKPDYAEAYNNRGIALNGLQQFQEALESFDKAISLKSDFAEAYNNRGNALHSLRQSQAALESFDKAISLKSDFADAYNNRGSALHDLWQYQAAAESFDKAISLKSDFAEAYKNHGLALHRLRRYPAALESFDKAMLLSPNQAYLNGIRLNTKQMICDWEDIEDQRRILEAQIDGNEKVATPSITLAMTDCPARQKRAAEVYVRDKYPSRSSIEMIPHRPKRDRIRIGYFSADYYNHATCYLMAELFERHDRSRFEIIGFSFGPDVKDEMSQRVSVAMDRFQDVRSLSDRGVAQLSRDLEVDIAVDLKGFTKDARFGIFAERAAPIQVNYLGYPGTTGSAYMDYLIADHTLIPESSQQYYSEKIVYLPDSYQANDSQRLISDKTSSRAEEGLPEQGVVFCCFNKNYKIMPGTFDLWMRVLGQVEGSVLWLLEDNLWVGSNLRKEAARRGVSPERLIFARRLPLAEHLARHRLADLFLDTFPCNAHTTASDALWAGLPVLTCMGEAFASRVAGSLLRAVDLPELVTTTEADYEALALEIALNSERRHAIREQLRQNLPTAPMFNIRSFTNHVEAAYRAMYERYQMGLPPAHIHIARPGIRLTSCLRRVESEQH